MAAFNKVVKLARAVSSWLSTGWGKVLLQSNDGCECFLDCTTAFYGVCDMIEMMQCMLSDDTSNNCSDSDRNIIWSVAEERASALRVCVDDVV